MIVMLTVNFIEALILASIFYNLPNNTSSFFYRGSVIFMLVLLNGFGSMLEIFALYAKRTIIEKHNRYALYHPSAEALSSMIFDLPYKVLNSALVNTTLYFMAGLRLDAGAFFFFYLLGFIMLLSMSMFFRLFASVTKTIAQALAPSAIGEDTAISPCTIIHGALTVAPSSANGSLFIYGVRYTCSVYVGLGIVDEVDQPYCLRLRSRHGQRV